MTTPYLTVTDTAAKSLTVNIGCLLFVLMFMHGYIKLMPVLERWLIRRRSQLMRKISK